MQTIESKNSSIIFLRFLLIFKIVVKHYVFVNQNNLHLETRYHIDIQKIITTFERQLTVGL